MTLPQLFADSATPGTRTALTTLSGNGGSITSGATSMKVAAAPSGVTVGLTYPGQFDVVVDSEIIRVTAGASGTTWTIARGIDGSTAASHSDGANVFAYPTAGSYQNLISMLASALQNGIIQTGDLLVGTISINTGTGALTFTPAATGTLPAWVANTSGLLIPTGYGGGAQTITPSLPASTKYAVIGVEIDTTGTITLVKGTDTATQLNTAALIAANSPAQSSGKLRIADFAYWNNAGTYNFGDHTTTATLNTNWVDRRPLANVVASLSPTYVTGSQYVPIPVGAGHMKVTASGGGGGGCTGSSAVGGGGSGGQVTVTFTSLSGVSGLSATIGAGGGSGSQGGTTSLTGTGLTTITAYGGSSVTNLAGAGLLPIGLGANSLSPGSGAGGVMEGSPGCGGTAVGTPTSGTVGLLGQGGGGGSGSGSAGGGAGTQYAGGVVAASGTTTGLSAAANTGAGGGGSGGSAGTGGTGGSGYMLIEWYV